MDNGEDIPMSTEWLWQNNDGGLLVKTAKGDDGIFVGSNEATIDYVLEPGRYGVITHLNEPSDEAEFTLLVRSHHAVSVK